MIVRSPLTTLVSEPSSAIEQQIVAALDGAGVPTSEVARVLALLHHEVRWLEPSARVQSEWNLYRNVTRLLGGRADA